MLKPINRNRNSELQFNPPEHEHWNIVHTGMLVPGAHQIYVCAENCMRGVVLTAAEMNMLDRFSSVIIDENDLIYGSIEKVTVDGTADVLNRMEKKPPVVLLFLVCLHFFLGCNTRWIINELEKKFPDITFIKCYMDPIMQKQGPTPDQKCRGSIYEPLKPLPAKAKTVSFLGSDFKLNERSDIKKLFADNGWTTHEIQDFDSFEDYLSMAEAEIFVATYPNALLGTKRNSHRLSRPYAYLPSSFDYEEIKENHAKILEILGDSAEHILDVEEETSSCEALLKEARELIGDTPISIDCVAHPRPNGLAKLLLEHGFNVKSIYLDAVNAEEQDIYDEIIQNHPEIEFLPTIAPAMRVKERNNPDWLAVGPKAAWFNGTKHFVNIVEGEGLWGFDGVRRMIQLMMDAYLNEKDTKDLVPRKGLGCESCI